MERTGETLREKTDEYAVLPVADLGNCRFAVHRVPVSGLGEHVNGDAYFPVEDDLRRRSAITVFFDQGPEPMKRSLSIALQSLQHRRKLAAFLLGP